MTSGKKYGIISFSRQIFLLKTIFETRRVDFCLTWRIFWPKNWKCSLKVRNVFKKLYFLQKNSLFLKRFLWTRKKHFWKVCQKFSAKSLKIFVSKKIQNWFLFKKVTLFLKLLFWKKTSFWKTSPEKKQKCILFFKITLFFRLLVLAQSTRLWYAGKIYCQNVEATPLDLETS